MYLCNYQSQVGIALRSGRDRFKVGSGSLQGRGQGMTDRPALPNPSFFNAQHAEFWSLQRGGGGESGGDLLCGCFNGNRNSEIYSPPFPPSPTIGKMLVSESEGLVSCAALCSKT